MKTISFSISIKNYDEIWIDLRSYSHVWRKVLVPSHCVHDLGVSEAVYSSIIRNVILEKTSPVIFMRAKKNDVEQEGMQRAHILDGAALCDAFSLLERRVSKKSILQNCTTINFCFVYMWEFKVFEYRDNHRNVSIEWCRSSTILNEIESRHCIQNNRCIWTTLGAATLWYIKRYEHIVIAQRPVHHWFWWSICGGNSRSNQNT